MYELRHKAEQADRWSLPFTKQLKAFAALMLMSLMVTSAAAASEDEVRATFDRFVAAQNAHDIKAVESLLLASPDFLWVTRGTAIWGRMRHSSGLPLSTRALGRLSQRPPS